MVMICKSTLERGGFAQRASDAPALPAKFREGTAAHKRRTRRNASAHLPKN
jgi:hypothetical protein